MSPQPPPVPSAPPAQPPTGGSTVAAASATGSSSGANPRKVKFVAVDTSRGGLPVKRKQVQHACAACRRRKRRCVHAEDASTDDTATDHQSVHNSDDSPLQTSPITRPTSSTTESLVPLPTTGHDLKEDHDSVLTKPKSPFITDYHGQPDPSALMPAPAPESPPANPDEALHLRSRFVGDLNPEGMFIEATGSASARQSSQKGDVGIWLSSSTAGASGQASQFITARPPLVMDRFLLPFVKEHCLTCLPPSAEFCRLKAVYVQKIHPVFPIVPLDALNSNVADPSTILLRQLVSLAAATDPESSQSLRLGNQESNVLPPQEFSQSLSSSIRAILETSIIPDRVLHIRALTVLSLYAQPTCAEEADLPAQLGSRAIHHIQTLGLHLLRYDAPNGDDLEELFCAVWALDRINGAMYGRPCLLHERDIGANLEACIRKCPPCFRLLLLIVQWLEQVVELYRPGPSAEASGLEKVAYIDLPVLEAMIVNADALKVPSSLIATIETFYHAVIILSCRLPRPGTKSAASTLPPASANARRSLAAERIACAVPRDCLSPVPFVPYAVSLALSVEYRKMRHSRLPMFRARAMNAFKRNCEMLRNFGDYFWSANVVAGLGERVLKEMERAATTLTTTKEVTPLPGDVAGGSNGSLQQNDQDPWNNVYNQQFVDQSVIDMAAGMDNMVDFSMVDAISGQDVFGHIDPNFNLNAVEDALEANLDIGLPLNWGDWGRFAT